MTNDSEFSTTLRGYVREEVDALIARAEATFASQDSAIRAVMISELRSANFATAFRGYDRYQVKSFLNALAGELEHPA